MDDEADTVRDLLRERLALHVLGERRIVREDLGRMLHLAASHLDRLTRFGADPASQFLDPFVHQVRGLLEDAGADAGGAGRPARFIEYPAGDADRVARLFDTAIRE